MLASNVADPAEGGLGTLGQGYESVPIHTIHQGSWPLGDEVLVPVPDALVQDWIDGTNPGLLFRGRDQTNVGRVQFRGASDSPITDQPRLNVTLWAPAPPAELVLVTPIVVISNEDPDPADIRVEVRDLYGELVTSDNSTVVTFLPGAEGLIYEILVGTGTAGGAEATSVTVAGGIAEIRAISFSDDLTIPVEISNDTWINPPDASIWVPEPAITEMLWFGILGVASMRSRQDHARGKQR